MAELALGGPDGGDWELGIDEAGRGSLVGPMVVGGCLVRTTDLGRLAEIGVRDSKLLSAKRREAIYRELGTFARRVSVTVAPQRIDRRVRRGQLNRLEAEVFARLVRRYRPARVFVDACDPIASRFGAVIAALAAPPSVPVEARHRADREIPVVAAASIVAKVRRDRALARLRERLGDALGSGYPSDVRTVEFVRRALENELDGLPWLRLSWATTRRLKRLRTVVPLEAFAPG
jgi:ribonuclease HII